ncbi:nitrilase-related carbon-nitrogen hydrolase [Rubrobacter tropicus]|uniref:nitrilase-related carbon-nitrogen hydrolase n=1 Tax=Rubrobacter tropicus TaxID=2653851 RepID=UPI00140C984E|nr:nitrilase-related carbon-nitrogen hydrolase [Rubrobacter tropicus]
MTRLDAVLAQPTPKLRDVEGNVEKARGVLSRHAGADLVVFPELFLSGYTTRGVDGLSLDLDGPEVGEVARLARENGAAVIFGVPERVSGGVANSAVCVDRTGRVVGSYRKTHLFGDERGAFVAGDELMMVELDGIKTGLLICFDVEFPEVARSLALAGADLLVTISANMDPFGRDHDVFATARALENGLTHLYVNQVGPGEVFTFAGGTMAVSADGERLAQAGPSEGEVEVSLDLSARDEGKPEHLRPNYLEQRRPQLSVRTAGRTGE